MSKPQLSFDSSDEEITAAIKEAGKVCRRSQDLADPDEKNQDSWVIPRDIGVQGRTWVKRLHGMVARGTLEVCFTSRRKNIQKDSGFAPIWQGQNGMPRFRVKQ